MAKSQQTFKKKEREKKRLKKREDKKKKMEARKASKEEGGGLDSMIAYVDEFGNITDTPPDLTKKKKIKAEDIEISVPKKEKVEEEQFRKGTVDYFNHEKGFGFIKAIDSYDKFFVHIKGCNDPIDVGNKVTFEVEQGLKGLNAVNVSLA